MCEPSTDFFYLYHFSCIPYNLNDHSQPVFNESMTPSGNKLTLHLVDCGNYILFGNCLKIDLSVDTTYMVHAIP